MVEHVKKPKGWRFSINRNPSPLSSNPTKLKFHEKAGYVHPGQLGMAEYKEVDGYWTSQVISQIHYVADTGKIPVSGGGYGGSFAGPGFDGIWFGI